MSQPSPQTTDHLRGRLHAEPVGARGIEHYARNPTCERLGVLVAAQIKPETAVREVYGRDFDKTPSPFAILVGNRFENYYFEQGAARLLALYQQEGLLTVDEFKVVHVTRRVKGRGETVNERRKAFTRRLLDLKRSGDPRAPHLIIKPRLEIDVNGVQYTIEPDYLVAATGDPFYRPGEMKSYPDRAGKTDPSDIRNACRQCAVGLVGLRQELRRLGAAHAATIIAPGCDLVLRVPGSFQATLRPMTIRGEVASIERITAQMSALINQVLQSLSPAATLDDPAVLDRIPHRYCEACKDHCALAQVCKEQAISAGDPVLLGNAAREDLLAAGSLPRALDLMHGRVQPGTPEEAALQDRLQTAFQAYRQVANYGP